jgi:hypothetical protein
MQQRQLRLGDSLDDYCPRERRVTNHAVVAMVGVEVKQTRCTTCDAEHEYKGAKVPPLRKKKDAPPALHKQVLTGLGKSAATAPLGAGQEADQEAQLVSADRPISSESAASLNTPLSAPAALESADTGADRDADEGDGPVHRPLIRATLPRTEGTPPARQMPEFTVRQNSGRPGKFRADVPHRHPAGGGSGSHAGGGGRHAGRSGIQAGRGGNRALSPHQPRPAHHPHARTARPGKKHSQ